MYLILSFLTSTILYLQEGKRGLMKQHLITWFCINLECLWFSTLEVVIRISIEFLQKFLFIAILLDHEMTSEQLHFRDTNPSKAGRLAHTGWESRISSWLLILFKYFKNIINNVKMLTIIFLFLEVWQF